MYAFAALSGPARIDHSATGLWIQCFVFSTSVTEFRLSAAWSGCTVASQFKWLVLAESGRTPPALTGRKVGGLVTAVLLVLIGEEAARLLSAPRQGFHQGDELPLKCPAHANPNAYATIGFSLGERPATPRDRGTPVEGPRVAPHADT